MLVTSCIIYASNDDATKTSIFRIFPDSGDLTLYGDPTTSSPGSIKHFSDDRSYHIILNY
jgi:hypothetical protein